MMEGVSIGSKHSWNDWGLIWTSISISSPKAKTKVIEIPGSSYKIDLSEVLCGHVGYEARKVSLGFTLHDKDKRKWQSVYSDIQNFCHGKRMKVILDTDLTHYWDGRLSVSSSKQAKFHSSIEITLDADPYKYEVLTSLEDWLWDPFNFDYDVIREYGHIVISGSRTIIVVGSAMPCFPEIVSDSPMTLTCKGKTYQIPKGNVKLYDLTLYDDEYQFTFEGNGTVSIDMRGGSL